MNILVVGRDKKIEGFLRSLNAAGICIDNCEEACPHSPIPLQAKIYDWLILCEPACPEETNQLIRLRESGITAPAISFVPASEPCNSSHPVLIGAVERKNDGEKILNCNLTSKVTPHHAKNSFGEIIYEYHAPCRA